MYTQRLYSVSLTRTHTSPQVRWAPTNHHHSLNSPYSLKLASVDHSCVCVIWDVYEGSVYTEFSLGIKSLVDLQWLTMNVRMRCSHGWQC